MLLMLTNFSKISLLTTGHSFACLTLPRLIIFQCDDVQHCACDIITKKSLSNLRSDRFSHFPPRISILLDIILRSIIHSEIFLCVCYEVRVEIFLTFLLPHHILPSPFPSSHSLPKNIIILKKIPLLLLSFFWFQVYIYLSWCHLLKIIIISSLNCIGTFVKNQLTINIKKHF